MKIAAARARFGAPALALLLGILLASVALRAGASDGIAHGDYVLVRHTFHLAADGSIAVDEESRTTVSAAYVVNNHIWAIDDLPIRVQYNPADAPPDHDVPKLLQDAIATWNAAGSDFAFEWGGESEAFTGACNGQIRVDGVNNIKFTQLPPLTLGQTCTIYPPGTTTKLVEFDMQLNPSVNWSSILPVPAGKYDIATTILHELGHAAGIGHNCGNDVSITCDDDHKVAVMYPTLATGTSRRALTGDDIDAIRAAYGAVPTPSPSATPTASPTPTESATPTAVVTVPPGSQVLERARAPQLARD